MSGLILEGTVFGQAAGQKAWCEMGNVTEFTPKENAEQKVRKSMQKNSYGDALDTVNIRSPSTLTFTLDDWRPENMALLLLANVDAHTQAAAAISLQELVIGTLLDCWYEVGHKMITGVQVFSDAGGATELVLDTDFKVEPTTGMILPIAGGAISASSSVYVTYAAPDLTTDWIQLLAGTNANKKLALKVCARNLVTQEFGVLIVPQVVINPANGLNVFSEDYNSVQVSGNIIRLPTEAAGYRWETAKAFSVAA